MGQACADALLPFATVEVVGCQHLYQGTRHHLSEWWHLSGASVWALSVCPTARVLESLSAYLKCEKRNNYDYKQFIHLSTVLCHFTDSLKALFRFKVFQIFFVLISLKVSTQQDSLLQWANPLEASTFYMFDKRVLSVFFGCKHIISNQIKIIELISHVGSFEKDWGWRGLWNNAKANCIKLLILRFALNNQIVLKVNIVGEDNCGAVVECWNGIHTERVA